MPDRTVEFRHLYHLIGGYFHQDWDSHGRDAAEVVRFYNQVERVEKRKGAVADIDRLLKVTESEQELGSVLCEFGCAYRLEPTEAIRDWLSNIRHLIEDSIAQDTRIEH